jgi:hypothetical protein
MDAWLLRRQQRGKQQRSDDPGWQEPTRHVHAA